MSALDRDVVVTPYGSRYHRIPLRETARMKDAACGGFNSTTLSKIPESEAIEQGYTACINCDWITVATDGGRPA